MTKLFEATCVPTSPAPGESPASIERADISSPAPTANRIVNLTLTLRDQGRLQKRLQRRHFLIPA
jgi:hypothetical protein